jgi:hypothetical protein
MRSKSATTPRRADVHSSSSGCAIAGASGVFAVVTKKRNLHLEGSRLRNWVATIARIMPPMLIPHSVTGSAVRAARSMVRTWSSATSSSV